MCYAIERIQTRYDRDYTQVLYNHLVHYKYYNIIVSRGHLHAQLLKVMCILKHGRKESELSPTQQCDLLRSRRIKFISLKL